MQFILHFSTFKQIPKDSNIYKKKNIIHFNKKKVTQLVTLQVIKSSLHSKQLNSKVFCLQFPKNEI